MTEIFFNFTQENFSTNEKEILLPKRQSQHASGFDLASANKEDILIKPNKRSLIPTGISIELPAGLEGQIRSRSGLSYKNGVIVLNSPGTIDADYRGEIKIILANFGEEDFIVKFGMRVAQLVLCKVVMEPLVIKNMISSSLRGSNGFGSTGI